MNEYDFSNILGERAERIQRRFEVMNWIGFLGLVLGVMLLMWL
jgi:hypothetical protein